jgi:hypothetical protein
MTKQLCRNTICDERILGLMSVKQLKCPDCGGDAKYIKFAAEEIPVPYSVSMTPGSKLERPAPLHVVVRDHLVECPEHGLKIVQVPGNHVTEAPKKRNQKGKRRQILGRQRMRNRK